MGKPKPETKIIKDALRRFRHLPTMTISKHILTVHGDYFDGDLELIRGRVRYYRDQMGKKNRKTNIDKSMLPENIQMPKSWRKKRTPYNLDPGLWLVLSDVHIPFHEIKALEAAVSMGQIEKVDGVFLLGDIMDCAALSYWPQATRNFNREIDLMIDFLDWLRQSFPKQKIIYKPGNHEARLPALFMRSAPELADTLIASDAMEGVLGLREREITFLDYTQIVMAGMLPMIHGHEARITSHIVNPARSLFLKFKSWGLCAHSHRSSNHTETNVRREYLTCWSIGCLCDLSPDYNPVANNWNWGFALVNVEKDGNFEVMNKRILPDGQVVSA